MARKILNKGTTANDGSGDTLRTAAGKINDNFSELYSFLGGDALTDYVNLSDSGVVFNHVLNSGFKTALTADSSAVNYEVSLPAGSGSLILETSTATLTNKTLTSPTINNPVIDGMKVNDDDSSHQYTLVAGSLTANRNMSLPNLAANDTFVFAAQTQSLTNKTLTSPNIVTAIQDAASQPIIKFTSTASAENEITLANAADQNGPTITATGTDDADIDLNINTTGEGAVRIQKLAYGIKNLSHSSPFPASDSDTSEASLVVWGGGAQSFNLNDGKRNGEQKVILNRGTGDLTMTFKFGAGTKSTTIKPDNATSMIWYSNEWFSIYGGDSAGTGDTRVIIS